MRRVILLIILGFSVNCFALQKNTASQKWVVFAFDETDNTAKTGDAANITANVRIDGAAANAVDDTNPTELEDGYYVFDITATESNGDCIVICPASSTGSIQVIGAPMAVWTDGGVTGTGLSAIPWNASWDAEVESEVEDAVGADVTSILTDTSAQDTVGEWDTLMATVLGYTDDIGIAGVGLTALVVDVTKVHGTALTETSGGNLAGNMSTFWDNADAATAKVVDNVGAAAAGGGSALVINAGYLGNFKEDNDIAFTWRSIDQGGAAIDPSTAGTIKIYKEDGDTEVTAPTGITDTRGFDGLTGIHMCKVDLGASTFYARNKNYSIVLTGAVVDSQTVTAIVATFSIEKRYVDEFDRGG